MTQWNPQTLAKADIASSTALEVARRLRKGPSNGDAGIEDLSLAGGEAGLAVLYGYLDRCFPTEGWDKVAHEVVVRMATRLAARAQPGIGLYGGLAGFAFSIWYLSRSDTRYGRARAAVEDALLPRAVALATTFAGRFGLPVEDYDLVSGLSGVAAYLLCRSGDNRALLALQTIIAAIVELVERDSPKPAWFTPPEMISTRSMIGKYPHGSLNCGLAHGMPGMLSILALAYREQIVVPGQRAAIARLARWLAALRQTERWGDSWPAAVGVGPSDVAACAPVGWCYGNPGIARSLWLAGAALDDADLREIALAALRTACRRMQGRRNPGSPTFCHGAAGLLQITMRFASETALPDFRAAANSGLDDLLSTFCPEAAFGYRDYDPETGPADRAGLLDGSAGIALVLLAAASREDPSWDRIFLLS